MRGNARRGAVGGTYIQGVERRSICASRAAADGGVLARPARLRRQRSHATSILQPAHQHACAHCTLARYDTIIPGLRQRQAVGKYRVCCVLLLVSMRTSNLSLVLSQVFHRNIGARTGIRRRGAFKQAHATGGTFDRTCVNQGLETIPHPWLHAATSLLSAYACSPLGRGLHFVVYGLPRGQKRGNQKWAPVPYSRCLRGLRSAQ